MCHWTIMQSQLFNLQMNATLSTCSLCKQIHEFELQHEIFCNIWLFFKQFQYNEAENYPESFVNWHNTISFACKIIASKDGKLKCE